MFFHLRMKRLSSHENITIGTGYRIQQKDIISWYRRTLSKWWRWWWWWCRWWWWWSNIMMVKWRQISIYRNMCGIFYGKLGWGFIYCHLPEVQYMDFYNLAACIILLYFLLTFLALLHFEMTPQGWQCHIMLSEQNTGGSLLTFCPAQDTRKSLPIWCKFHTPGLQHYECVNRRIFSTKIGETLNQGSESLEGISKRSCFHLSLYLKLFGGYCLE